MTLRQRQNRSERSDTSSFSDSDPQESIRNHQGSEQNPVIAVDVMPREAQVTPPNDSQNAAHTNLTSSYESPTAAEVPTAVAEPIEEIEQLLNRHTLGLFPSSADVSTCKDGAFLAGGFIIALSAFVGLIRLGISAGLIQENQGCVGGCG